MTRKRFVKLLMSYEMERNTAISYADLLTPGQSYSERYKEMKITLAGRKLSIVVRPLTRAMVSTAQPINAASKAFLHLLF